MRTFFHKLLHVGVRVSAFLERLWAFAGRLFRRKGGPGPRASGRLQALARRESENERLDRLRHPGNYRGR